MKPIRILFLFFCVVVLSCNVSCADARVIPGKYCVRAVLNFSEKRPVVVYPIPCEESYLNSKDSQAALIRSSIVLEPALEKGIANLESLRNVENRVRWLAEHLKVTFEGDHLLIISLYGNRKEDLPKILDAVRESYLQEVVSVESDLRLIPIAKLNRDCTDLGHQIHRQKTLLEKTPASERETRERLSRKIAADQKIYDEMSMNLTLYRLEMAAAPERVKVITECEWVSPPEE